MHESQRSAKTLSKNSCCTLEKNFEKNLNRMSHLLLTWREKKNLRSVETIWTSSSHSKKQFYICEWYPYQIYMYPKKKDTQITCFLKTNILIEDFACFAYTQALQKEKSFLIFVFIFFHQFIAFIFNFIYNC